MGSVDEIKRIVWGVGQERHTAQTPESEAAKLRHAAVRLAEKIEELEQRIDELERR
jgi:hypothetical protein